MFKKREGKWEFSLGLKAPNPALEAGGQRQQ
jgi:hypothetical protein